MFNPLAALLTEMRHAVVDPDAPHVWDLAGPEALLVPAAIVVLALVLGAYVFTARPRGSPSTCERTD